MMQFYATNQGPVHILTGIPFKPDLGRVMKQSGLQPEYFEQDSLNLLLEQILNLARPAALYRECQVEAVEGDVVRIEGEFFQSRVLRKNLENTDRVFAFLATCGAELNEVDLPSDDSLLQFLLEAFKGSALGAAREYLIQTVSEHSGLENPADMSPGSAENDVWTIKDQKPLFSLFQNKEKDIGVRLTESFLMVPAMTISGLLFSSDSAYHDCRLCQRKNCRSRSAEYDPALRDSLMGQ